MGIHLTLRVFYFPISAKKYILTAFKLLLNDFLWISNVFYSQSHPIKVMSQYLGGIKALFSLKT